MIRNIIDKSIKFRVALLLFAAVLAGLAYPASRQLDFDRTIENMFGDDDPLLPPYFKLKETFGGNEVVAFVYVDESLFNQDGSGIRRLAEITSRLKQVPGVQDVLSLAEINQVLDNIRAMDIFRRYKTLTIVDPKSGLGRSYRELFAKYTHGMDGKTVAAVCMLYPRDQTDVPQRETVARLREIALDLPDDLPKAVVVGEPVMVVDGFQYVEDDGRTLGWATTILLGITIIVCFRSLRWVVVCIAVVQFAILMTKATLVWARFDLSMVSSMLTAIITVTGIAMVVHVMVRVRESRSEGMSPRDALRDTLTFLAIPVMWTCLTDAVGFGSLLIASAGPVQDFGLMMAIGSLYVLASAALLLPGLALIGGFDTDPRKAWGETFLTNQLGQLVRWVEHSSIYIGLFAVIFVSLMVVGIFRLDVETDFTKNFRGTTDIVRSYEFVENNLGGAGVWDVVLPSPSTKDNSSLSKEYLELVSRLEDRLRNEVTVNEDGKDVAALTKVVSVADADLATRSGMLKYVSPSRRLGRMQVELETFYKSMLNTDRVAGDFGYLRVMLRARERQSASQKLHIISEVERIVDEELNKEDWQELLTSLSSLGGSEVPQGEVTGFFVLLTNLIKSMIRDQWICFGAAILGVGIMMLIAFRSPTIALVALVPNILPILIVFGMMGWLGVWYEGVKINMGAAMIAAVSMGLSVDSSIHYITSFRRSHESGKSVHDALIEVEQSVGLAAVFATLALVVGFSILCTSNFIPTVYFGILVSLSMLGGLFGNLLVLPMLLKLITRDDVANSSSPDKRNEEALAVD